MHLNRWTLTAAIVAVLISPVPVDAAQTESAFAGTWEGIYSNTEGTQNLVVRITFPADRPVVEVKATSNYSADPQFQRATDITVTGSRISFVLNWGGPVRWEGELVDGRLEGDMRADHWAGMWEVERVDMS